MPKPVLTALLIEIALLAVTILLLVQPKMVFQLRSSGIRKTFSGVGFIFLCLTFCWSFVLGSVLTLNEIKAW